MSNTGGKNADVRVLHCSNMDFPMILKKCMGKQFGKVERIRLKLTENETSLGGYIVFNGGFGK